MTLLFLTLWAILSTIIIGVFVWTTRVLWTQKKTWGAFAARRGLTYQGGSWMDAPKITGVADQIQIYIASEERSQFDFRGRRYVTAVQLGLPYAMGAAVGLATGTYRDVLQNLGAPHDLALPYPGWTPDRVMVKTDNIDWTEKYFTSERCRVLDLLIGTKDLSVFYLFEDRYVYLRFESPDPMLKDGQLDKLFDKILPLVKTLAP